jgi:asparagine synthase (glutamine-hydrolysing)
MSGIVGVVNWDGTPVDRRLIQRMMTALDRRGPDAQGVWLDAGVGLGHAWLQTTAGPDPQPFGLDGHLWIVADARVDDRTTLVDTLHRQGERGLSAAGDAALILHAYRRWGEDCLRHILGDFAFAIWDGARRRLFCARDHFGVKPFYYAPTAGGLVFSNTLQCVRLHPDVSGAVDEQAIADFLRFGLSQDPATTAFRAIRRLPAAHCLAGAGRLDPRRYWRLPVDGSIRYGRPHDYVDRFGELLTAAVADRLRGPRAGVLMSGGLDSTSVAATAQGLSARTGCDLRAYTAVCERAFVDPERRYAALAAQALGIAVQYRITDDYEVYERWGEPELRRPEPESDPLLALNVDLLQDVAAGSRVALTGHGGDPVFRLPLGYATRLLRRGRGLRLAREIGQYVRVCRRLPRVRIGAHLRRRLGPTVSPAGPPDWLDPDLVVRLDPAAGAARPTTDSAPIHPTRPAAYALLTSGAWAATFESFDPGVTGVAVEVRHPFFDVRLVEYLLAIPPMPWAFDKTILRLAMRGRLPEAVRLRPKTVAAGDPLVAALRRPSARWVDRFEPVPALRRFVRRDRVPAVHGRADAVDVWTHLRPLCLNYWLSSYEATSLTGRTA